MTRPGQNDDGAAPEGSRHVVVEFSHSPSLPHSEESTPSHETETKTTDDPQRVRAAVEVERPSTPLQIANRYNLLGELGVGGQASVYLADDATLGRKVAIKMPRWGLSRSQQEQFRQEARAIAALRHPGIVAVYDFGIHDDGRCYIVLEYLPGQSLKDCLKAADARQTFSAERTVELIARVAEALHYAHQQGIYHRDLKPGNVLLDEHGNPRITDFGLAITQESQQGLKGQVAGTTPYMAPEQVRGEAHWLNGQADIWALGVILYEMLAGRRPFLGAGDQEIKDEILRRTPKPLREIDPRISEAAAHVVMTCLEKDAARRYSTAGDVARALRKCLEKEESAQPAQRPAKKGLLAKIALAIAVLFGLTMTITTGFVAFNWANHSREAAETTSKLPLGPREWHRTSWIDLLDRPPEVLAWDATSPLAEWKYQEGAKKIQFTTDSKGLLSFGDVQEKNYDLRVTLQQTPWTGNGNTGVFLGYSDFDDKVVHYQVFAVQSNMRNEQMEFSVDRVHIMEAPGRRLPLPQIHIAAANKIEHPGFRPITLLVSVRKGRVDRVEASGIELPELRLPGESDVVPSTGAPVAMKCNGVFGIYIGSSSEGVKGEVLKAELFIR